MESVAVRRVVVLGEGCKRQGADITGEVPRPSIIVTVMNEAPFNEVGGHNIAVV